MAEEPPSKRKCLGADCPNDAGSLQCPTCLKLGIKDSFFCAQDCFKKNWATHKVLHAQAKPESSMVQKLFAPKPKLISKPDPDTGVFNPWPAFAYTGSVRPVYPLSPRRLVPPSIPRPDYADTGVPQSRIFGRTRQVTILNDEGIEGMRTVCRLAREVLDIAAAALRPGISTDEIDAIVHQACIDRNVRRPPVTPDGQRGEASDG